MMEFKMSKWKVGQSVYLLYEKDGRFHIHEDMFVVQRVSEDELGFHYSIANGNEDIIDWCRQEDLFCFLDSAIEESIERNLSEK
jgi:hypothetical protein